MRFQQLLIVFFLFVGSSAVLAGPPALNSCGDSNYVCTIDSNISSDQNWVDGNTYVILADVNVTGTGTDLNIAPGVVVKFGSGRNLIITDGGRLLANGTVDKNIFFVSCKDQNSFAGSTNADTSSIPGCSGVIGRPDYNTAIFVKNPSGMALSDSFSYIRIFDHNHGIFLDKNIASIHHSIFDHEPTYYLQLGTPTILIKSSRATNLFDNQFLSSDSTYVVIHSSGQFDGNIYNNNFVNMAYYGVQCGGGSYVPRCNSNVFNNRFSTTGLARFGFFLSGISMYGSIYNNFFEKTGIGGNESGSYYFGPIYNNLFIQGFISLAAHVYSPIENNTFMNAGTAIGNNGSDWSGRIQRNLFAHTNTVLNGSFIGPVSHNAYFNVTTFGGAADDHNSDVNSQTGFTVDPFIGDGGDRNFMFNSDLNGGAKLVDAGNVDLNAFYLARTTQYGNKLDVNKLDIGFHFDQNAPYVQVLSPSDSNSLTGEQSVDFNVESAFGSAANITAALAYSTASSGSGTSILSQALSAFACSALPVASCSYAWDTTSVTDGNYFVRLAGTDLNGTGVDYSDANFVVSNDSTAPVTSADYNNAWQNVDANVVLTCVDASGCLLTQFRLDSDSSDVVLMGGWQTFDSNLLISSDGNWGIDFNSTDLVGNRETTNRVYVRIDKSLPSLSLTVTSVKTVGLSATLSFLGSSESGIKKYWISSDGGTTYSDNGTTETYSFSVSSAVSLPHTRRVYIKAMNNADINTAAQSVDVLFEPAGGGSTSVSCGNNICEVDENASVCPLDCPNVCGDRACTHTENNFSCPFDCAVGCGNGICDVQESDRTCPTDCGRQPGEILDVTVPSPTGSQNPVTVPLVPQNKACEKDADCGVSTACSISRCIRNQCYGGQLPEGEPCDVGSVCKAGVCTNVSQQLAPVSESDPILWVSISVIVLALGAIGYEYFKK